MSAWCAPLACPPCLCTGYSGKVLAADGQALSNFLLTRKVLTKQEVDRKKADQNTPIQCKGSVAVYYVNYSMSIPLQQFCACNSPRGVPCLIVRILYASVKLLCTVSPWQDAKGSKRSKSFHLQFKYGKRESVAYAASRLPAVYGTTLRVLTEVSHSPTITVQ